MSTPEESTAEWTSVDPWLPLGAAARVGVARGDITPPVGIRAVNWGAARTARSTGVHRPITATALSIGGPEGTTFMVTLDLGWFSSPRHDASIRGRILTELNVPEDNLLLHLIHTHAGPTSSPDEVGLEGGELIPAFVEATVATVTGLCRTAENDATDCDINWSYGHCDLAVVRDLPCGDMDVVAFNPQVAADDTVTVGRVAAADGTTVAVLLNYACHPTTLAWDNSLLSPDYIGAARNTIEESTGALCLFLQGACGDVSPREQYVGDTGVADRNGRSLGFAALSVLASMPVPGAMMRLDGVVESGCTLGVWTNQPDTRPTVIRRQRVDVQVQLKPERTAAQVAAAWPDLDPVAATERARRAERLREAYAGATVAQHPVWVWMIGDAVIVAQPGEAYSLLQTELRRRHPGRVIFVLSLTNGPGYVYLPTREAYQRNRYQVWQTIYQAGALEAVIDEVDAVIRRLPAGRS